MIRNKFLIIPKIKIQYFPEDGINIIGNLLHTHLVGKEPLLYTASFVSVVVHSCNDCDE